MGAAPTIERCANCDRAIGKLETPHLWREQVVCAKCYKSLGADPADEGGIEGDVLAGIQNEAATASPRNGFDGERERMMRGVKMQRPPASSSPAAKHELIGGLVALVGMIVAVVGFKNYSADGASVGISAEWGPLAMTVGAIVFTAGVVWFAVGRIMRGR